MPWVDKLLLGCEKCLGDTRLPTCEQAEAEAKDTIRRPPKGRSTMPRWLKLCNGGGLPTCAGSTMGGSKPGQNSLGKGKEVSVAAELRGSRALSTKGVPGTKHGGPRPVILKSKKDNSNWVSL